MKKLKCIFLLWKYKPDLCFISVYYKNYEVAVLAARKFSKLFKTKFYIYKEKTDSESNFFVTSNVKSGADYMVVIGRNERHKLVAKIDRLPNKNGSANNVLHQSRKTRVPA
jgi:hypothetical protein